MPIALTYKGGKLAGGQNLVEHGSSTGLTIASMALSGHAYESYKGHSELKQIPHVAMQRLVPSGCRQLLLSLDWRVTPWRARIQSDMTPTEAEKPASLANINPHQKHWHRHCTSSFRLWLARCKTCCGPAPCGPPIGLPMNYRARSDRPTESHLFANGELQYEGCLLFKPSQSTGLALDFGHSLGVSAINVFIR